MTTEIDPIRWTASPEEAPELLRGPLAAAAKEGPSAAQMRMLTLKLAAVSAGAAAAASASTAQASAAGASTAGGVAAAPVAALPFAKIVAAVAVVGVAAWGGVSMLSKPGASEASRDRAAISAPAASNVGASAREQPSAAQNGPEPVVMELAPAVEPSEVPATENEVAGKALPAAGQTKLAPSGSARAERGVDVAKAAKPTVAPKALVARTPSEAHESASKADVPSEMQLLRKARASLAARPREAYALTEQHREHYPRGVFAQERDALAIEALLRAGDTESARGLAKNFVRAHPNSPHAHRFRETLGLR